jgi:uncharacterized protein
MRTSVSIQASKVTFPNQLTSMAGNLFVPPNMDKTKKYPALAVAHPFGGVKEAQYHTSRSVFIFTDFARLMDFNDYARIEEIAPRPILLIIGTRAATIFTSKAGYEEAAQPKEWFEVPGATHHSLYDHEAQVGEAVAKLEEFFGRNL